MTPTDFHLPFQPYAIQQQFMSAVYDCIEEGKVGIFESPTGTGKSLSLICGSLTWLREHKLQTFNDGISAVQVDDDEPDWMLQHAKEEKRRAATQLRADFEARLVAIRIKEERVRRTTTAEPPQKRRKRIDDNGPSELSSDDQFVLDDYESDSGAKKDLSAGNVSEYSSETQRLMQKLGSLTGASHTNASMEMEEELKIYFCSRTHSQLSQFVGELRRVKLPPGLPRENSKRDDGQHGEGISEELKHLTLGSRKNLCINPKVAKLVSATAINERCLELQKPETSAEHKCSFLPSRETEDLVLDFRDHALAEIRDIEDLAGLGTKLGICPYYASRPAIGPSEIITLPYPLLLQKSARRALGINLKNHVVIIDEAHNLMEAVAGMYSSQISENQLREANTQLTLYLQKFRNRLKGKNRIYVAQVIRLLDSLMTYLGSLTGEVDSGVVPHVGQLTAGKGVDQIDLAKLIRYMTESKLARKVEGYATHLQQASDRERHSSESLLPALTHAQNFFLALINPSAEGRFFWEVDAGGLRTLRYMLLDPSEHFRQVVEEARAVILAGGTMSPMEDYIEQLLPYLPSSSVTTLSCGHVVPPDNLFVRTVPAGTQGDFDFTYAGRNNMAQQLGESLLTLLPTIRGGTVVFFSSYQYLAQVLKHWKSNKVWDKMIELKPIFSDSPDSLNSEDLFSSYTAAIKAASDRRGATLLSVLGGRLSEGINFSDNLGRCVVVVGLPYPNLDTPEWKAKMQYIEDKATARGEQRGKASREHAENVCMRAVNQAIGRVVRHKDDWASILLLDKRYQQSRIQNKLPGWIRGRLPARAGAQTVLQFGDVARDLATFFECRT